MKEIVDKNWPELSKQLAELQVKALLRVIYKIGKILENRVGMHLENPQAQLKML
jgi:hypothetical protein